jgi:hypothetical protein
VIIKVVAGAGKYSCGLKKIEMPELAGDLSGPRSLYYFSGQCKMVGMGSRGRDATAPDSFPPHPDFAHL